MASIIINGKTYNGSNISMNGNNITIDGASVSFTDKVINITVNGNIDKLDVTSCDKLEIHGDVDKAKTMSGDINCRDIKGDASTMSGDIKCQGSSLGNVKTTSGDIKYNKSLMKD